jgi:hypothetical protein
MIDRQHLEATLKYHRQVPFELRTRPSAIRQVKDDIIVAVDAVMARYDDIAWYSIWSEGDDLRIFLGETPHCEESDDV